jgi:hypothetical protein
VFILSYFLYYKDNSPVVQGQGGVLYLFFLVLEYACWSCLNSLNRFYLFLTVSDRNVHADETSQDLDQI